MENINIQIHQYTSVYHRITTGKKQIGKKCLSSTLHAFFTGNIFSKGFN